LLFVRAWRSLESVTSSRFCHASFSGTYDNFLKIVVNAPADVLIVEPLDSDVLAWLSARHALRVAPELAFDPRGLRQALPGVRALVVPPALVIDAATLLSAPLLRIVCRLAGGGDNIDIDACARAGVEVVRPAAAHTQAEAEFAIGALLQMLRRMPILNSDGTLVGRELGSCTVGLVGMAPTAKPLAQLLTAFGAKVLGHDPGLLATDSMWHHAGVEAVPLPTLLMRSDAVCVLLQHVPRYDGLFDDNVLSYCKQNQVLLSLSQAQLFVEGALARALGEGPMCAAWFDQMAPSWLDDGRPLRHADTLQVTPRIAGITQQSRARSAWAVAGRIDEVLAPPPAPPDNAMGGFRPSQPGALADLEDV
jgi:D-3-phosphoglycerate dehydrogenase / 2-oxoglutarate reductase